MFIDVNYRKRPKKAKLYLAKPNKVVTSPISEKFGDSLALKLGNISELTFSIPHFIYDDDTGQRVKNEHIETIKEKMLIKSVIDTDVEWFIVDSITESSDDSDVFNVTAFSLGYELKRKRISDFESESITPRELLEAILDIDPTDLFPHKHKWTIGTIDSIFENVYRSFESGSDSNALDCIMQWAETFGGLLVWDTINRKVSLKDMKNNGKFRGMTVNYGQFLNSVTRTRTTDEMVTRLFVYGSEELGISSVNPTGQAYLEDFSYFMFPFKRDANRNVIQSSHFMSDELCHAILDHEALVLENAPEISSLSGQLSTKIVEQVTEESKLTTLNDELENILELLDVAKAVLAKIEPPADSTAEKAVVTQREAERDAKNVEIQNQTIVVNGIEANIVSLNNQLSILQGNISNQANFTQELLDELDLYVITETWRDDRYINADELYADAVTRFKELREPKVVIEISMDSLMNVIEEQYYWDKLVLGDLIKVKYPQMDIEYMARIIEINIDFENGEASLVIANNKDLLSETEKLVQLLYSNSSASTLVQNNKYKWNKVNAVEQKISNLLTSEWDANKNKIIAGVNNTVEVGSRGIIVKNPDFPTEMVIIQAGIIALSKDNGETWKTAIKPDGIVAERLIGQIIAGTELMITNSAGSFTLDNNGAIFDVNSFKIRSGTNGNNLVDRWEEKADFIDEYIDDNLITAFEKKMLMIKWEEMAKRYASNSDKLALYYPDGGTSLQFVNDYHDSYDDLYNYLFVQLHGDSAMLAQDNLAFTTRVVSADFDSKFRVYDTNLVELEDQLLLKSKEITDSELQEIKDNIDEVMNDVVYKIELQSTLGDVFRNGDIDSVIVAKVYRGKDDITSTIPSSGFIWRKKNKDGVLDVAWNNAHINVGKQITIDRNDVLQKSTFECDIDIT
mgnify:CR=1 FL=1